MIGLGFLLYCGVVFLLGYKFCKYVVDFFWNRDLIDHLAKVLFTGGFLIFLTWPFAVGRLIFEIDCATRAGLYLAPAVDASKDGYLLQGQLSEYYLHQATQDLITGRIGFFEIKKRGDLTSYSRYSIDDINSPYCLKHGSADRILSGLLLPAVKCLSVKRISQPESKFEVKFYGSKGKFIKLIRHVEVKERGWRGHRLASNHVFQLDRLLFSTLTCPRDGSGRFSPFKGITSMIFKDKNGSTVTLDDLSAYETEGNRKKFEYPYPREFPPRELQTEQKKLASKECRTMNFGDSFDIYEAFIHGGRPAENVYLDAIGNNVGEIDVIVNQPGKRSLLSLHAYDPVIWKICRTKESEIAGVIVTGHRGAAVLGVDLSVPVAINTKEYNPGFNCNDSEHYHIKDRLYHIKDPITNFIAMKTTVKANDYGIVIGLPPSNSSELICSSDRKIEDFIVNPFDLEVR